MKKRQLDNKGFGLVGILAIVVVLALVGCAGAYVYHRNHKAKANTTTTSNSSTQTGGNGSTGTSSQNSQQVTPQDFVTKVLASMTAGNETQLEQYLSPQFKIFRQSNLAGAPCKGSTTNLNYPSTKPLALFCASLLDPKNLVGQTPSVSDFTFKDGQKGKSVDYKITQTTGDAGTTYYTFKLLPNGYSWQLHDYSDVFVQAGSATPSPLLGERESLGQ